jgi:hypothetical protein
MPTPRKKPAAKVTPKNNEIDFPTPLEEWAFAVEELIQSLRNAGLSQADALWFAEAKSPLPDWLFPVLEPVGDDFDDIED